jgi:hypothetical protein
MPKITADVPGRLYKFLRNHITEQRLAGTHITVSTIITNLLYRWERQRFTVLEVEDVNTEEGEEKTDGKNPFSIDTDVKHFSFEATGEEIKQLFLSASLTTEEAMQVADTLVRITQELLELTETVRKK